MSDQAKGGRVKSPKACPAPSPHLVSRAEFFPAGQDFDLFGEPFRVDVRRGGPVRHVVTRELSLKISELRRSGLSLAAVSRAVGIGYTTLARYYFSEISLRPGQPGRRCHAATADRKQLVASLAGAGQSQPKIAKALGISIPTLIRHYRAELDAASGHPKKGNTHDD